ncbi:MAG: deoxyribonuclease IV [Candidatus Limnocylindrales bacterium]
MQPDPLAALAGRRVGVHLPLAGGMVKATDRAVAIGATCLQVFSDNPSAWRRRAAPPAELPAFRARLLAHDLLPLAVHGPYLLNLAASDDTIWDRTLVTLVAELRTASSWGAAYCNVHIGSHRGHGPEVGIARIAEAIRRVLLEVPPARADPPPVPAGFQARPDGPLLVLENSAGGGDGLGGTVEELAAIQDALAGLGADTARVGFCLDTAHAWGAGYEISRPEAVDRLCAALEAALGPGRIAMVHLNDSKAPLGSHLDRHEHIGVGAIGAAGLRAVLLHPSLARVPFYLETPGMDEGYDAINMERVRTILRGEPLPELPPAPARAARRRGQAGTPSEPSSSARPGRAGDARPRTPRAPRTPH